MPQKPFSKEYHLHNRWVKWLQIDRNRRHDEEMEQIEQKDPKEFESFVKLMVHVCNEMPEMTAGIGNVFLTPSVSIESFRKRYIAHLERKRKLPMLTRDQFIKWWQSLSFDEREQVQQHAQVAIPRIKERLRSEDSQSG